MKFSVLSTLGAAASITLLGAIAVQAAPPRSLLTAAEAKASARYYTHGIPFQAKYEARMGHWHWDVLVRRHHETLLVGVNAQTGRVMGVRPTVLRDLNDLTPSASMRHTRMGRRGRR